VATVSLTTSKATTHLRPHRNACPRLRLRSCVSVFMGWGRRNRKSPIRQSLASPTAGVSGVQRDFMVGKMLAVISGHPPSTTQSHPKAWMYKLLQSRPQGLHGIVNGRDGSRSHATAAREDEAAISKSEARAAFQRACGAPIGCDVLSFLDLDGRTCLVAEGMQRGRVFLRRRCGASVHSGQGGSAITRPSRTRF